MARADFARVLRVVVEILFAQEPLLVAEQAIRADLRGIELDLNLHVLGDGHEVGVHLLDENFLRLFLRVEVVVIAVALVRELVHEGVFEVVGAHAERREIDAALCLLLNHLHKLVLVGHTDVEVAVGAEQHAVHAALDKILGRDAIGFANAALAIGGTGGFERIDGGENLFFVRAGSGREFHAGFAGINDDGHAVALGHALHERAQSLLDERQPFGGLHRAGDVDEENEIARRPFVAREFLALERHAQQTMPGIPGTARGFDVRAERLLVRRRRVTIREVVDQLLNAHRIARRKLIGIQKPPHVCIRAGVHIDGERGERSLARGAEGILDEWDVVGIAGRIFGRRPEKHVAQRRRFAIQLLPSSLRFRTIQSAALPLIRGIQISFVVIAINDSTLIVSGRIKGIDARCCGWICDCRSGE